MDYFRLYRGSYYVRNIYMLCVEKYLYGHPNHISGRAKLNYMPVFRWCNLLGVHSYRGCTYFLDVPSMKGCYGKGEYWISLDVTSLYFLWYDKRRKGNAVLSKFTNDKNLAILAFKCLNDFAPSYLQEKLKLKSSIH